MTIQTRAIAAAILFATAAPVFAAGDLLVAPTRVVLDGARGTEVILNNVGNEAATYRISLELRRMTATGSLEEVAPEAANAKEAATLAMISYAPRRVVLAPNQPQAIRIGVRPPADLPDGEYRAHMLFRAIPPARPVTATDVGGGVSIALTPIYGITIPIIVRKGALRVSAQIADPHVETGKDGKAIAFTLARSGDRSTYGRIRVTQPGAAKPLIEARGIAAYAEIAARKVSLPVDAAIANKLVGPVRIEYLEEQDAGGGLIAETSGNLR